MSTAIDTKTQILDVALDLIQRQSLSGVSFQELANRIGIKKGSMYYHFPSKEDLVVAVMERAGNELKAAFEAGAHKTPTERLRYFFHIYFNHIGAGERICPGAACVSEWDQLSTKSQELIARLLKIQAGGVEDIIADGLEIGEFNGHGNSAKHLSLWVISSIQGALLTSRAFKDKEVFVNVTRSIENTILKKP